MKIKIESNVFDILDRIREIDDGYFLIYDTVKNKYELHNLFQCNTYCLTVPFEVIDEKLIKLIYETNVCHIDNILKDIDNNNAIQEKQNIDNVKYQSEYMVREIYKFANNSSKNFNGEKSFKSEWS